MQPAATSSNLSKVFTMLVLGLLAGAALLMAVATVPNLLGYQSIVVLSGSMEPALGVGDIAVVRDVDPATVKVGDVVTYRAGSWLITHRVISIEQTDSGRLFHMKGDANSTPDAKAVGGSEIVAKVAYSVPKVGYVVSLVNSAPGRIGLIAIPALLLLLMAVAGHVAKRKTPSGGDAPKASLGETHGG